MIRTILALLALSSAASAQITTILGSDTLSDSRTTINDNFSYLNTQIGLKLTSPLTTKGDILVYGSAHARLAVGTNNYCLVANSSTATGLEWKVCTAATATALAANGANCSAGQFPLGVDASGAAETCTALPTTIAGTSNEIAASASTGAVVLSLPSIINLSSKTLRLPNSTTLPATCTLGDVYMDNNATAGQNIYACTATNTWTLQGDGGGGSFLPLAGGTMTGQLITDNLGIEFGESDTNPTCAAGNFNIFADLSENKLKKCTNGTVSDLDAGGGSGSAIALENDSVEEEDELTVLNMLPGTNLTWSISCTAGDCGITPVFGVNVPLKSEIQSGSYMVCAGTGSASAQTCAMSPTLTAYTGRMTVEFIPEDTNTTTQTLNIDTIGTRSILRHNGDALQAGDLTAGLQYRLTYNVSDTTFRLPPGGAASSSNPKVTWIITPTQGVGISTTQYISSSLAPSATEAGRYWISPVSGTVKNLRIGTLSSQPGDGACVCTVRINGIDSSVTATIAASAAAGTIVTDLSNTGSVTAGQKVTLKCANASGSAATTFTATMEVW